MNATQYPLSLRIYKRSVTVFNQLKVLIEAIFSGFWLGMLDRQSLQLADGIFYDNDGMYRDDDYNRSGFWDWEAEAIQQYFGSASKILVAGAGGGREIYALTQAGYKADGFECNPTFVSYANEFLRQEKIDSLVKLASRDRCPEFEDTYDGLIVGWGAYTNIQGKQNRIEFLKQMLAQTDGREVPILISFFPRKGKGRSYRVMQIVGNILRIIRSKPVVELGDSLLPHRIFVHYFIHEEVKKELENAGFELKHFSNKEYGYAIAMSTIK